MSKKGEHSPFIVIGEFDQNMTIVMFYQITLNNRALHRKNAILLYKRERRIKTNQGGENNRQKSVNHH